MQIYLFNSKIRLFYMAAQSLRLRGFTVLNVVVAVRIIQILVMDLLYSGSIYFHQ